MTWPTKKLGEVCDILDNLRKPITRRDRAHGPYPYYGATGIQDHVAGYIFDEELILVGEDGARWEAGDNSAYKISGKSWVNNHAHVLRPHKDVIHEDWLTYFLNISDLSDYITGTTVKKLNQAKLRSIEIPLPPLSEQKKIVVKLEKVLGKIKEAKSLRAKAQEDENELLSAELHKIFEEGKRKRWEEKQLGEITELVGGGTPKTNVDKYWNGTIAWITPKDMGKLKDFEIQGSNRKITEHGLSNSSAKLLPVGTVVLSSRAPIGYVAVAGIPLATNQGCRSFICKKDIINNKFLYYYLISQTVLLNNLGGGSTFKEVSGSKLKQVKILVPPYVEQKKIVARLDILSDNIHQLQDYQKTTQSDFVALEQAILSKAFSGPN